MDEEKIKNAWARISVNLTHMKKGYRPRTPEPVDSQYRVSDGQCPANDIYHVIEFHMDEVVDGGKRRKVVIGTLRDTSTTVWRGPAS